MRNTRQVRGQISANIIPTAGKLFLNDSQKSQSRCWDWALPTVVTQSFLSTADNLNQKLTKRNCWKTECSWNPREQEAEFSLGNTTEGDSLVLLSLTQLPLTYLVLDQTTQLHNPTENSCRGQAVPAQPALPQLGSCCKSPAPTMQREKEAALFLSAATD